jgi:hypothetical protein
MQGLVPNLRNEIEWVFVFFIIHTPTMDRDEMDFLMECGEVSQTDSDWANGQSAYIFSILITILHG